MSDRQAVALALCVATGAAIARPVPVAVGVLVSLIALVVRRPALLCLGGALLATALGSGAWSAVTAPTAPGPVSGVATLVSDPVSTPSATRATVKLGHRRLDAWARGDARAAIAPLLAGDRIEVAGRVQPMPPELAKRFAWRHVVGRLTVDRTGARREAAAASRISNFVRRTLARGAEVLPARERSLFGGFVLGDDREQDPLVVDDFRGSGLSHLLVVSGQNVAFVLALAAPLVRRGPLPARFAATLVVLALFGVLTRWEPSVLRAEAMAAVSMLATTLGRPASTVRVLALAVTLVVLVDPLLVRSLGFLLSVSACAGIALLARPFEARIPGPQLLRTTLSVTLAAQVGVAPLLIGTFGGVPVASVPANLLATPVAGLLMGWGLAAGMVAGVLGGHFASVLHLPTRFVIAWIADVAHAAASWPLPLIDSRAAIGGGASVVLVLLRAHVKTSRPAVLRALRVGAVLPVVAVVLAHEGPRTTTTDGDALAIHRAAGEVVVVVDRARAPRALARVRREGVHSITALVARRRSSAETTRVLAARLRPRLVVAPQGTRVANAVAPADGAELRLRAMTLRFRTAGTAIQVEVLSGGAGGGRMSWCGWCSVRRPTT